MSENVSFVPEGSPLMSPMLAIQNAGEAIDFFKKAFGAEEMFRLQDPTGKIPHAQIRIGNVTIMLAAEATRYNKSPPTPAGTTLIMNIHVPRVDDVFAQAIEQGAKVIFPLSDQFYGDRCGRLQDPFGHQWIFSTHVEDLSQEEMQRRFQELFA